MPTYRQICFRLAEWIDGKVSLAQFEDWFVPATWSISKSDDTEAEALVDEIELNLSEYSGGHLSKEQLRQALRNVLSSASAVPVDLPAYLEDPVSQ